MNELEMIKAFAELEGIGLEYPLFNEIPFHRYRKDGVTHLCEYSPITDLALNCAARDKYRVENDFDDGACFIYDKNGDLKSEVSFNRNVSMSTIECILKSEGLWK